jgi:hypothetical protein
MMRRVFWMGVGAVAAIVVVHKVRTVLKPYAGAAAPVTGAVSGLRSTFAEIRSTMAAHEAELRATFIEDAGTPDRPRSDPRQPHPRSWARRVDEDEELYSF